LSKKKSVNVLFYDLTTVYFETNTQDEIRDFGFSKDGKSQHVQIMLAVIVTQEGLPIDYVEFKGNCYEGHTLIPVIENLSSKYDISKAVLVADAALMNKINLTELDKKGIKYVISAKIKCSSALLKKFILAQDGYQIITQTNDKDDNLKDCIRSKIIELKDIQKELKESENSQEIEEIEEDKEHKLEDRIIVYHSTKRARKDSRDRLESLERISKYVDSTAKSKLTGILRKPYVKISKDCKIEVDAEKLNKAAQFDGFFGLRTNIVDPDERELLSTYRGLWQVEQTFRIAKSNLEIRPVFHYTTRRIKAHFAICYLALALIRYVDFAIKNADINITYEQLHMTLFDLNKTVIVNHDNQEFELLQDPPLNLIPIYQALKLRWPKKFCYIPNM
jgi:transposase